MQKIISILFLILFSQTSFLQTTQTTTSTQIYNKIQKLNFLGSVLYVAAHPDDENTSMISYYSNNSHARVGYISITRGDGGQNLIGPEIRELLGVIRTQELLSARKIDGGTQFFTRANDFGYSKHPDETFEFWDKEDVLSDLVYVIRKFKPDVIINRFDHRTPGTTHGHHTASATLSVGAFKISNDKTKYPEQLNFVDTWQPKRQFYNTSWWFYGSQERFQKAMGKSDFFRVNIGAYYPELGVSNTEISALSRSQHKSQGFGVAGSRGNQIEYLEPINGEWKNDYSTLFEGIDTTWNRVEGGAEIGKILTKVQQNFDFKNPANNIPQLLEAYRLINNLKDEHWKSIKLEEIQEIILDCAGLFFEVSTTEEYGTRNEQLALTVEVINRSTANVSLKSINIPSVNKTFSYSESSDANRLENNVRFKKEEIVTLPDNMPYTSPYWLKEAHSLGMYTVNQQELIGTPENKVEFKAIISIVIDEIPFEIERNVIYKTTSPSEGEIREPFAIVPSASLEMDLNTMVFADNKSRLLHVDVKAFKDDLNGVLKLNVPNGWKINPNEHPISIDKKGKKQTVEFTIIPPENHNEGFITPLLKLNNGEEFVQQLHILNYSHIPTQTVLTNAQTKVIRLDIQKKGENIGYIIGAGDDVPASLKEIGYQVTEFYPKEITLSKLQQFDAIVLGIRAYDLDNDLPLYQDILFEYIKDGGTVITQYNSLRELKTDKLAPYELSLSHDRVTDENAAVKFLEKDHPILTSPNVITEKDFEGWVQERGLYFANKWGKEFTPILGMNDKGEKMHKGSLLVAEYGKGYFVYTGLSFFRELPAGVSGAYRLFANLLSLGK